MRKVKLQMQLSVDGFVAGQAGETGWQQCSRDAGLKEYIRYLKDEPGCEVIEYGSSNFDMSLIREGRVDEYYFFIHPTAIGKGRAIFQSMGSKRNLRLVNTRCFECGVVMLFYKPE